MRIIIPINRVCTLISFRNRSSSQFLLFLLLQDEYVQKWEDTSKEVIGTFLNMFGQRFDLEHFWNTNRRRITQALSPAGSPDASEDEDEESEDVSKEIFVNEEPSAKRPRHSL